MRRQTAHVPQFYLHVPRAGSGELRFVEFTSPSWCSFRCPWTWGWACTERGKSRGNRRTPRACCTKSSGLRLSAGARLHAGAGLVYFPIAEGRLSRNAAFALRAEPPGRAFLLEWFFQAHDQMHWVGLRTSCGKPAFAALVFLFCRRGTPLLYIGLIECASVSGVARLLRLRRPLVDGICLALARPARGAARGDTSGRIRCPSV